MQMRSHSVLRPLLLHQPLLLLLLPLLFRGHLVKKRNFNHVGDVSPECGAGGRLRG